MTKAELQKVYDQLQKEHKILARAYDAIEEDKKDFRAKFYAATKAVDAYRDRNAALEESEHAIRCVRLPHVELENEELKKRLDGFMNECARQAGDYREALGTLKTLIQNIQRDKITTCWNEPR